MRCHKSSRCNPRRYGAEAGELTKEGCLVIGNCLMAASAIRGMRARALLRKTAKKTAHNVAVGRAAQHAM